MRDGRKLADMVNLMPYPQILVHMMLINTPVC